MSLLSPNASVLTILPSLLVGLFYYEDQLTILQKYVQSNIVEDEALDTYSASSNTKWVKLRDRIDMITRTSSAASSLRRSLTVDDDKSTMLFFMLGSMFAEALNILVDRSISFEIYSAAVLSEDEKLQLVRKYLEGDFRRDVPIIVTVNQRGQRSGRSAVPGKKLSDENENISLKLVLKELNAFLQESVGFEGSAASEESAELKEQIREVGKEMCQIDETIGSLLDRKGSVGEHETDTSTILNVGKEENGGGGDRAGPDYNLTETSFASNSDSFYDESFSVDLKSWYCNCSEYQNQMADDSLNHPEAENEAYVKRAFELHSVDSILKGFESPENTFGVIPTILRSAAIPTKHKTPLPLCSHLLCLLVCAHNKEMRLYKVQ